MPVGVLAVVLVFVVLECVHVDGPLHHANGSAGRVVEIYGPEASGKTTLSLHVIAQAQKAGSQCAFVDAEHALDAAYARY